VIAHGDLDRVIFVVRKGSSNPVLKMVRIVPVTLLLLFVLATAIKLGFNLAEISEDQKGHHGPSDSAAEAKTKGTLTCKVSISPKRIEWKGQKIEFAEAWLEERVRLYFSWAWLRRYESLGDFQLCFILKDGNRVFQAIDAPFFVVGDERSGVGSLHGPNTIVFFHILHHPDFRLLKMSLVSSLDDSRRNNITLIPQARK
jgi:hypothetical protein